jgi:hypothetical protein
MYRYVLTFTLTTNCFCFFEMQNALQELNRLSIWVLTSQSIDQRELSKPRKAFILVYVVEILLSHPSTDRSGKREVTGSQSVPSIP